MSLFLRPNADYSTTGWTSTDPGSLFPVLARTALDESHFISAFGSFGDAEAKFNLSVPTSTPAVVETCFARCYANKLAELGDAQGFEIRLYQGPSLSLIASQSFTLTTADTLLSLSFSSSSVSDWSNLVIGLYRAATVHGNTAYVYQAWVEIPGFPHLDVNGPGYVLKSEASGNSLAPAGPGIQRLSGPETTGAMIDLAAGFTVKT